MQKQNPSIQKKQVSFGSTTNKSIINKKKVEEVPKQEAKKTGFTQKPSAKLDVKKTDIFGGNSSAKSDSFQYVYNMGGIPCQIDHGSIKNRLKWNLNIDINQIGLDPLLITCFEGLVETKHPFSFIANQACVDLLSSENAENRVTPLLQRLSWPLRNALRTSDSKCFMNTLAVFKLLVQVVGSYINPHLKNLLSPLSAMMRKNAQSKQSILDLLNIIHDLGGEDALKMIRSQVPDYFK